MKYKFLDVGCKIGGSFSFAKKFGFENYYLDLIKNKILNASYIEKNSET